MSKTFGDLLSARLAAIDEYWAEVIRSDPAAPWRVTLRSTPHPPARTTKLLTELALRGFG